MCFRSNGDQSERPGQTGLELMQEVVDTGVRFCDVFGTANISASV
jgi:hypothetical protein